MRKDQQVAAVFLAVLMMTIDGCMNSGMEQAETETRAETGTRTEAAGPEAASPAANDETSEGASGGPQNGTQTDGPDSSGGAGASTFDAKEAFADPALQTEIEKILADLTAVPHSSGSEGETQAAEMIRSCFDEWGYETSLQPFTQEPSWEDELPVSGTNVIAVRKADGDPETADILVIGAHHDAKPGIEGADNDASGVAVLLETAKLVSALPTDTELRFVSFAGEENGRIGSRFYVESLTDEEKSRMIGQIQLDELGYYLSDGLKLDSVDGQPTLLGNLIAEKAKELDGPAPSEIPYDCNEASDHNSFVSGGIPAVSLKHDGFTFENHSMQDRIGVLEPEKLSQAAVLLSATLSDIMSAETGSYLEESARINPVRGFQVQPQTGLWFAMSRNFVENMLGFSGKPAGNETNEFGDTIEKYDYAIRWFGMDEPIETEFEYRNGFLETVTIPYREETGLDYESAAEKISESLGEPEEYEAEYGMSKNWDDPRYHKYYSLTPLAGGGYTLEVMDSNFGKDIRRSYDLAEDPQGENGQDAAFLELVKKVIYPEDLPVIMFNIYSDGYHNSTGYSGGLSADDNTRMEYALDEEDAFDENGNWIEYGKTVKTAVHEYGHILSLNAAQVDITKQDPAMPSIMFPQETYTKDAYMRAYYRFWKDGDVKSGLDRYHEHPDEFVSEYAAGNMSEDFAETFSLFVLSDKPEDDSVASQKIRFFYDYEELVQRRDYIRKNFGLDR